MPKISFDVDEVTYNIIKKKKEIWKKDTLQTYNGTINAVLKDIWTGWIGFLTVTVLYHPEW